MLIRRQEVTQPLPLREQMKALEHLQELDLKIDALQKKKAAVPGALKALETNLQKTRTTVEAKRNAIGELEKVQRQTKAAIDLNNDRLTRANAKLENVGNSQEFQAANKEIDQLKKLNGSLEEQLKKTDQEIEAASKELTTLEADLTQVQENKSQEEGVLSGQSNQFDADIAALTQQRAPHVTQVDKRVLGQYDRVRVARGGLGIVPAIAGRCKGCNMMVPPQLYNEVQRGNQVHQCPSCHRILFVPGQEIQGSEARA